MNENTTKDSKARLSIFFSRFSSINQKDSETSRKSYLRTIRHYICRFWFCLSGNDNYKRAIRKRASRFGINSRSELDVFARIFFPVSFGLFNILYWFYFLHLQR
jgi:hypothetical protein